MRANDHWSKFGIWHVISDARTTKIPLSYHLGLFGMPGLTAYASMDKIAKPKAGETIFVSVRIPHHLTVFRPQFRRELRLPLVESLRQEPSGKWCARLQSSRGCM
jgi:hypothetical protein